MAPFSVTISTYQSVSTSTKFCFALDAKNNLVPSFDQLAHRTDSAPT
jgi:hypothetical protein